MGAAACQVLGGKCINCGGPCTEPWGTSFQHATEMQSFRRQKMQHLLSLDPLYGEYASEYIAHLVFVCVCVYTCVFVC